MGYATQAHPYSGQFLRGGQFVSVGTTADSIDIQAIVPQTPADAAWELEDAGCYIQEINEGGVYSSSINDTYFYLTATSPDASQGAGWYTRDAQMKYTYANRTFVRGQGFILNAAYFEDDEEEEIGSSIMTAGEVKLAAKTIEHPYSGQFLRCNYRPVPLDIQKIVPNTPADAAWELEDAGCYIQEINEGGVYSSSINGTYFYLTATSPDASQGAGWYTRDAQMKYTYANRTFDPGQGFILNAAYFEDDEEEEIGSSITINE